MTADPITSDLRQYVETALWSSHDWDTGEPLDDSYGIEDLAPSALASMAADLSSFMGDESLADALAFWEAELGSGQAAHDFWLTRNGHGAGFWDRFFVGEGAEYGRLLTDAARAYGSSDLYIGDDGLVYVA